MIASVVTLAERPDLVGAMWSMANDWPAFMRNDPVAGVFFVQLPDAFPEHQLLALDEGGSVVGKVNSVPFAWTGDDGDLPERGWDAILERAFAERGRGAAPTAVSLPEARVVREQRGAGLSYRLLHAARDNVRRLGLRVHVRIGARIVKVCPLSMTVPGTLAQWREWTGLALTSSGAVDVPGALTPVHVAVEHDHAVYVEPNVWLHHRVA